MEATLARVKPQIVTAELLRGSNYGKLREGDLSRVVQQMGCGWKTASHLWKKYEGQTVAGVGDPYTILSIATTPAGRASTWRISGRHWKTF